MSKGFEANENGDGRRGKGILESEGAGMRELLSAQRCRRCSLSSDVRCGKEQQCSEFVIAVEHARSSLRIDPGNASRRNYGCSQKAQNYASLWGGRLRRWGGGER